MAVEDFKHVGSNQTLCHTQLHGTLLYLGYECHLFCENYLIVLAQVSTKVESHRTVYMALISFYFHMSLTVKKISIILFAYHCRVLIGVL